MRKIDEEKIAETTQCYSKQAIGSALKRMREERGIASSDLAYEADIHPSYYSMLENGRNYISVKKLSGILSVHQIPLSDFFQILEEESVKYD